MFPVGSFIEVEPWMFLTAERALLGADVTVLCVYVWVWVGACVCVNLKPSNWDIGCPHTWNAVSIHNIHYYKQNEATFSCQNTTKHSKSTTQI